MYSYMQMYESTFIEGLYSQKMKTLKNFKIKSKENKISHGRGKKYCTVDMNYPTAMPLAMYPFLSY